MLPAQSTYPSYLYVQKIFGIVRTVYLNQRARPRSCQDANNGYFSEFYYMFVNNKNLYWHLKV
jgi:hypothetical protein